MQNQVNQSLTPALLRELAGAKPPCVTVAIQTGNNARARLRDALRQVEQEVKDFPKAEEKEVLEAFQAAIAPYENGSVSATNLVILSSPGVQYTFTSETPVKECVVVNDEFHLRSLLPILKGKADFYILALSQTHPRILHCTESDSGEVAFPPSVPKSFAQSRETRQPDHDLQGTSTGGPSTGSMKGVTFGTSSDRDSKDEYLLNFYRMLDRGVNTLLGDSGAPLVVVAVEHELALYRSVNSYAGTVEPGIHGAPDGLKGGEMHRRALELIQSQPPAPVQRDLEHFEKNAGTGHASSHAQEIVRAAYEGRVSRVFYQESAEYRGTFDETRRRVKRHDNGAGNMRDLLNEIVIQTLRHGGEAVVLSAKDMPNGVPVCAVFRYPAPELQAASRGTGASHGQS